MPPDPGLGPEPYSFGDLSFVSWIHVARIQGRAYEELYSPAALKQSDEVRRSRVKAMADEVMEVMQRSEGMNVGVLLPGFPVSTYVSSQPTSPTRFPFSYLFAKTNAQAFRLMNVGNRLPATLNGPLPSISTRTNSCT